MTPEQVVHKLNLLAADAGKALEEVLLKVGRFVPNFVSLLIDELDLSL